MKAHNRLSTLADINVTNLVDVTLVLLIIFILVSPFIQMGIEVKTPEVADPSPLQLESSILVEIDKDAKVYLDHKLIVIEDIGPAVAVAKQALPDAPVLLEADGRVAYEVPVQVMNQIRKAGVRNISLVTQKESPRGQAGTSSNR